MYQNINFSMFCDAFKAYDRTEQFSYEGKKALFEYLEDYEEQTGEKIELDVIALCCDYTEYENLKELQEQYPTIQTIKELQDNTQYIPITDYKGTEQDNFIIQNY
jgi:hypothetical protein